MPGKNLRLLSLDGGGVRGLSGLYIIKRLMHEIDPLSTMNPCEYFDMIGGTSTGGYIPLCSSDIFNKTDLIWDYKRSCLADYEWL